MELHKRLFFTALGIGTIFYLFIKFSLGYWKRRGILHKKPKFLWGNIKGHGKKQHISEILEKTYHEYKGKAQFIGFFAYIKPLVLVMDLNLVRNILSIDAKNFMSRGLYNNFKDEPLSYNLFQLDGEDWQVLKEKVCPAFGCDKIESLLPLMLQVTKVFKRSFAIKQRQQDNFIITDLINAYSIDIISTLAFGLCGDTLQYPHTEFHAMTRNYMQNYSTLKAFLALEFPLLASLLQYKSYDQLASDYFMKTISDRLKEREWNRRDKIAHMDDLLNLLVENKSLHSTKLRLSDKEIAAQAFSFILNGLVPLNSTLTFCLYELALQPDLQQRARAEIHQVLKQYDGELTVKSLEDFTYIKQIIKETLRLHSPYPFLVRKTVKDYELRDSVFMLVKGNTIIIPIAAIHRDGDIYSEPERFDPNRFEASAVRQRHEFAWLPFGAGPRGCISAHFAELVMLVALVTLLQHYQYSPCSDTPIPLEYDKNKLLLTPKSEIKLSVERVSEKL